MSRIIEFEFVFGQEDQLSTVVALVSFWFCSAILAPIHEWIIISIVVPALLEAAYPRVIAFDVLSTMRAFKPDGGIVQNGGIQDQCDGQRQEQSKPSSNIMFRHDEQNEKYYAPRQDADIISIPKPEPRA
jgi:hypothetical protein